MLFGLWFVEKAPLLISRNWFEQNGKLLYLANVLAEILKDIVKYAKGEFVLQIKLIKRKIKVCTSGGLIMSMSFHADLDYSASVSKDILLPMADRMNS